MERSTRQRAAIQEALTRLGRPLLPQELLAEAQKAVPNLSLATIYRNIKGLIADGVVDVVSLPGETDRYEIHKHHHHHFHCMTYEPYLSTVRNNPQSGKIMATTLDYPMVMTTVGCSPEWLRANPRAAQSLANAYFDALDGTPVHLYAC